MEYIAGTQDLTFIIKQFMPRHNYIIIQVHYQIQLSKIIIGS